MGSKVRNWYLIYTKARAEEVAQLNLERQGYKTYLPKIKTNKRTRGRYRDFIEAMFPRYLFIQLDCQNENWMPIRSTLGVSSLVRFGSTPAKVPDDFIGAMQQNENEYGIHQTMEKQFEQGGRVEFIEGALRGYNAVIEKVTSQDRVAVLLDIVGSHTRVIVSKDKLALA